MPAILVPQPPGHVSGPERPPSPDTPVRGHTCFATTRLFGPPFLLAAHVASAYRAYRLLPSAPPAGPKWIHEIKHDGFRIMARRDAAGVRLISRNGHDFTHRFPLAAAAAATLPGPSFLLDGEAIVTNERGLAVVRPDPPRAPR